MARSVAIMRFLAAAILLGALAGASRTGAAGTLVINGNTSDPAPRRAWEAAVARFAQENPDIQVEFNIYDHESYKRSIRNWLTSVAPDVVFWFVGERMRQFVASGLIEDVSGLFTAEMRSAFSRAAIDLVSMDGKQYGIPYAYYQLGLYFRRDVLESAGVAPPRDFAQLLSACEKLRAAGITPFALGSKELWPAAAWFDYLNLRLNGYEFHMRLMSGGVRYDDPRVRAVFAKWRVLIDRDCFAKGHVTVSWQESQALLYQGRAAMMLIGNYIVANFPDAVRDKMDFVPFPMIDAAAGRSEEAPMNSLHIPAKARNKQDARRFLAYALRAEVQEAVAKAMLLIPVNVKATLVDDRFVRAGRDLLHGAENLTQFFDRDTDEDLATRAMKGFQEFMVYPDRLDEILADIERTRTRVYRN